MNVDKKLILFLGGFLLLTLTIGTSLFSHAVILLANFKFFRILFFLVFIGAIIGSIGYVGFKSSIKIKHGYKKVHEKIVNLKKEKN